MNVKSVQLPSFRIRDRIESIRIRINEEFPRGNSVSGIKARQAVRYVSR